MSHQAFPAGYRVIVTTKSYHLITFNLCNYYFPGFYKSDWLRILIIQQMYHKEADRNERLQRVAFWRQHCWRLCTWKLESGLHCTGSWVLQNVALVSPDKSDNTELVTNWRSQYIVKGWTIGTALRSCRYWSKKKVFFNFQLFAYSASSCFSTFSAFSGVWFI